MNTYSITVKDPENAVNEANKLRLQSKGNWFAAYFQFPNGEEVAVKNYQTYSQVIRWNGVNYGGMMDQKIGQWKNGLKEVFTLAHLTSR